MDDIARIKLTYRYLFRGVAFWILGIVCTIVVSKFELNEAGAMFGTFGTILSIGVGTGYIGGGLAGLIWNVKFWDGVKRKTKKK